MGRPALVLIAVVLASLLILPSTAQTVPGSHPPRFTEKKFMIVNGYRMAYVEVGSGPPIVFLHGNPTSSYLWRNVLPHVEGRGRLIAPDLIGMGDSDKLPPNDPSRYSFLNHLNFLTVLLERLGVKHNVTLVLHDWGSVLGFTWAYHRRFDPTAVRGIAFMESVVHPFKKRGPFAIAEYETFFKPLRASPIGEQLVLQQNVFIEGGIPSGILRNLTEAEMSEYRRPFLNPGEDRRPILTFARQVPVNGEPKAVAKIVRRYSNWLTRSNIPKLFIRAEPGGILTGAFVEFVRTFPNLQERSAPGIHYMQEDSPVEIGMAVANWVDRL